jgi:hypothetical protein
MSRDFLFLKEKVACPLFLVPAEEENEALGINGNKWGQAPFIP